MPLDALPHSHHRNDLPKVRDGDAFVPQLEEEGEEGEEGEEEEGEEGEEGDEGDEGDEGEGKGEGKGEREGEEGKVQAFSAKVCQVCQVRQDSV